MKRNWMKLALAAVLASGLVLAQPPMRGQRGQRAGQTGHGRMLQMLSAHLNLTDAQKEQAKAAFDAARQQAEPLQAQLKQAHEAMRDAVKTGKTEVEIEQLAARQGDLIGQVMAIHTKAMAKVYATLTPEQKQKADELHKNFGGFMQHRFGKRG